jgi:hypothetical protein
MEELSGGGGVCSLEMFWEVGASAFVESKKVGLNSKPYYQSEN